MSEVTRERQGQLVRKAFEILISQPDGLPAREVIARVEKALTLTPYEQSFYPNNPSARRFDKILRFSTIAAVKAGWLIKHKGRWTLTDAGRQAYAKFQDPADFMRECARMYKEWKRTQPEKDDDEEAVDSAAAGPSTTLEEAEESAWAEIESHLARINPYDFQDLVGGLLRAMGYHIWWIAPAGPDRGIDIIAQQDPLGVERGRIKVQVKRRADKISVPEVRSFMALLGDEDVGIFVATAGFTSDSEMEARTQEKRRIMLVDSTRLFDLWVEYYDRIPAEQRRHLQLRTVHFLDPED